MLFDASSKWTVFIPNDIISTDLACSSVSIPHVPSVDVHQERPCSPLHGLYLHLGLWRHWRIGSLQRVEIKDGRYDLIGNGLTASYEYIQAVQGPIDQHGITAYITSGPEHGLYEFHYIPGFFVKHVQQSI